MLSDFRILILHQFYHWGVCVFAVERVIFGVECRDQVLQCYYLKAGILQITTELAVLIVFGVVMIAIAVPMFKRAMTR